MGDYKKTRWYQIAYSFLKRQHPDWGEDQIEKEIASNPNAYQDIAASEVTRDNLYIEATDYYGSKNPKLVSISNADKKRMLANQRRIDEEARTKREEEEVNSRDASHRSTNNTTMVPDGKGGYRTLSKREKEEAAQAYIAAYDELARLHPDWSKAQLVDEAYRVSHEQRDATETTPVVSQPQSTPATPTAEVATAGTTPTQAQPTISTKVAEVTAEPLKAAEVTEASPVPPIAEPAQVTPVSTPEPAQAAEVEVKEVADVTPTSPSKPVKAAEVAEVAEVTPMPTPEPVKADIAAEPVKAAKAAEVAPKVTAPKVESSVKGTSKNKFQNKIQEQASAVEKAYADLRELYDNPTDEQILAVTGNNLRGYQRNMGNKAGSWGSSMFGTLNKETRNALETGYQNSLNANKKTVSQRQNDVIGTYGNGNVTRGMQAKVRGWGDKIVDTDNITPEQVRELNAIMKANGFTEFAIPTTQVTTKNDKGEDVVTNVEQNISLSDLLNSMSPDEIDALDDLGFIDDDLNYLRPHNETFEEKLARKERERERIELAAQQQALERQRTRAGLADLVAGFGDMAKAAGGAMVTPRDYQAVYNSLTAQQQKNYDNYLLRMQAAKEAAKQKQREAEQRAYQQAQRDEARAYAEEQQRIAWAREDEVTAQKHANELEKIRVRGEQKLKEITARNQQKIDDFNNHNRLVFGDAIYTFDKASDKNMISAILPIVRKYFTEENGYLSWMSGIENSVMSEYGKDSEKAGLVVSALNDFEYELSDDDKNNIIKALTDYSNDRKKTSTSQGKASVKPASAEEQYKHKETGEVITKSQLDRKSPSDREKYELVK